MKTRVRFAPAPTGMMHLGNVRTALMNYLLARQTNGTFILRIEDTDTERNYDPSGTKIIEDLTWLGISYDEGPSKEAGYGPYIQSERTHLYQQVLQQCIEKNIIYKCYCTQEELEKKRERQISLKLAPRYDRTCLIKNDDHTEQNKPFIWRVKLDQSMSITITDMARGYVTFDLKNFSDFPITRQDHSFTFMFANFVDDYLMQPTHILRGEDHLTNTAGQAFLYHSFNAQLPTFWHMPIICNSEGKKLSKRDFGFSLRDLKNAGFLPEAIVNYLAIIGGSFVHEIMTIEDLIQNFNFEKLSPSSQIKYDVEKLHWINHKWIIKLPISKITNLCRPYLENHYPITKNITNETLSAILIHFHQELITLQHCVSLLAFYFQEPICDKNIIDTLITPEKRTIILNILRNNNQFTCEQTYIASLKKESEQHNIQISNIFSTIRYALTGSPKGPSIAILINLLGIQKSQQRISQLLNFIN